MRGFVPGQTVPLEISVRNDSNVRVSKLRIVLKKVRPASLILLLLLLFNDYDDHDRQVVTYHTREKSRRHKEIVMEIELPVSKKDERLEEMFDIPSVPPTGMHYCTLIDVQYALKVEACVDLTEWYYRMLQKNLKIRTNVIVGSVPLNNYEDALVVDHENGGDRGKFNGLLTSVPCKFTTFLFRMIY